MVSWNPNIWLQINRSNSIYPRGICIRPHKRRLEKAAVPHRALVLLLLSVLRGLSFAQRVDSMFPIALMGQRRHCENLLKD